MFWKKKKKVEKQTHQPPESWKVLNEISQLDKIISDSQEKAQFLFKHSTRCGISTMVWRGFEKNWENLQPNADLYVLDLLNYREISNEIASRFQVYHQSPQLIVIRNGVSVAHASHGSIQDLELQNYF